MGKWKRRRLKKAYRLVFKDLSKIDMFRGLYDAKNGDESFMYGVSTVMGTVAFEAEDFDFEEKFIENMTNSEIKSGASNE